MAVFTSSVNQYVVGVLGGMGSYSTLHFFQQFLDAFDVEKEWERPRIVIDNNCVLPSRVRAILYNEGRAELVRGMAESIELLESVRPNVVAVPCHTAHYFLDEVIDQVGSADNCVLDMREVTAERCGKDGVSDICVLATEGTIETRLYDNYMRKHGITVSYPDAAAQREIRCFIEQVKQRQIADAERFVRFMDEMGAPAFLLGCTELSVIWADKGVHNHCSARVIDPLREVVPRIHEASTTFQPRHTDDDRS